MTSPAGLARLQRERTALMEERDQFTRDSLNDIFGCFGAVTEARRVIGESLVRLNRLLDLSGQLQNEIEPSKFEATSWIPFENKLRELDESNRRETIQRKKAVNAKILKMLRTEVSLPVALRLVSHLKEQAEEDGMIPVETLPSIFLQCREVYITEYILKNDPVGCATPSESFRRACAIMRGPVLAVLTQYSAIFTDLPPISSMLQIRFSWFFDLIVLAVGQTNDTLELAGYWNELVVLERAFASYSASFMPFVYEVLARRGVEVAVKPMDKAVALFIGSLGRTVIGDGEGKMLKSVPAFIMLTNAISLMLKEATSFCPPCLLPKLEEAVMTKLKPISKALEADSERIVRIRAVYESELLPYLSDCFRNLNDHVNGKNGKT